MRKRFNFIARGAHAAKLASSKQAGILHSTRPLLAICSSFEISLSKQKLDKLRESCFTPRNSNSSGNECPLVPSETSLDIYYCQKVFIFDFLWLRSLRNLAAVAARLLLPMNDGGDGTMPKKRDQCYFSIIPLPKPGLKWRIFAC